VCWSFVITKDGRRSKFVDVKARLRRLELEHRRLTARADCSRSCRGSCCRTTARSSTNSVTSARSAEEEQSSLVIIRNPKGESIGKEEPIVPGEEATFSMGIEHAPRIEAPIVFVGYGLTVGRAFGDTRTSARALLEQALGRIEASRRDRRHRNSESHRPGHYWERSKLARLPPALVPTRRKPKSLASGGSCLTSLTFVHRRTRPGMR
jgi:hypothetical protein